MTVKTIIWKKSPLPILISLAILLSALGYFESAARKLRDRELVVDIVSEQIRIKGTAPGNPIQDEELFPYPDSDELESWFRQIGKSPISDLRKAWETHKGDKPIADLTGSERFFEIQLLISEGAYSQALAVLESFEPLPEDRERYHLFRAITQNHTGDRADAVSSYERVLELSPNSYIANFNLGLLNYNLNRFTLSAGNLERAIRLAGGLQRANAYRALGRSLIKLERFNEARQALEESILLDPAGVDSRIVLADLYSVHLGDIQKSRELYDEVRKLNSKLPEYYLGIAGLELLEGDWSRAIQILEDATRILPESLDVILMISRIQIDWAKTKDAVSRLETLHEAFPNESAVSFQLGRAYYKNRNFQKAEKYFIDAIENSLSPPLEARNNLSLVYMAQEQWEQAERELMRTIDLNPWYETAHYNLGLVYINQENLLDAETSFQTVLEISPDHQESWYNLGIVYGRLGELNRAIDAYEQSLQLRPDDEKARLNLAVQYRKLGNTNKAEEEYKLVLEINPYYATAWFNLGVLQKARQDYSAAEISYRKALELAPEEINVWLNLSALLGVQDRRNEAIEILDEAIENHSESAELRYNLALQYKESDEFDSMVEQLEIAVKLDPNYDKAWKLLGSMQSKLGRHDAALRSYEKVIEIKPDDFYSHYLLGKEQFSVGDHRRATKSFDNALAGITDNAYIWYNAGKAYTAAGESNKAEKYYSKALDINTELANSVTANLEMVDDSQFFYERRIADDPGNPVWPLQLAKLKSRDDDDPGAEKVLLDALELFPTNTDLLNFLAETYENLNNPLKSESLYKQILIIDSDNRQAYINLVKSLVNNEKLEDAEYYLNKGLTFDSSDTEMLELLGEVYIRMEQYQEASVIFEKLVDLDSESGRYWMELGKTYYRQKKYADSRLTFEQAAVLRSDYVWSFIWLGRAYRKLGEFTTAEQQYRIAADLNPEEPQVWIALGDLFREMEQDESAREAYLKAAEINPTNSRIRSRIESVTS